MLDNLSFSKHTGAWSDCDLALWNNVQDAFHCFIQQMWHWDTSSICTCLCTVVHR